MRIELHEVKIKDVVKGYLDSADEGVVGYGGKQGLPTERHVLGRGRSRSL